MLTEKLRAEAGELDKVIEELFEMILDSDNVMQLARAMGTTELMMKELKEKVSPACYNAYKNIYYEVLGHIVYN